VNYVMVLNDGQTYSHVQGCCIVAVPDEIDYDEYEEYIEDALRERTPGIVVKMGV